MSELPPHEPPDLRSRRQSGQQPSRQGGQPPQGGQYPPQGGQYPPQGGQYPPQGGQYPPQGGQYVPPSRQTGQYTPPPGTGPLQPRQSPSLGGRGSSRYDSDFDDAPPRQLGGRDSVVRSGMRERRIEYLAWGSVVLIIGIGIMLLPLSGGKTARDFLVLGGPLLCGGILLGSGFLQRIVFGYDVSIFTWGSGIFSMAFGVTQWIAFATDQRNILDHFVSQAIYFVGLLVVFTGMVLILQVFSRPENI